MYFEFDISRIKDMLKSGKLHEILKISVQVEKAFGNVKDELLF